MTSTLGPGAVDTEPVVEQFFVLRAADIEGTVLPLERQVGAGRAWLAGWCTGAQRGHRQLPVTAHVP